MDKIKKQRWNKNFFIVPVQLINYKGLKIYTRVEMNKHLD